MLRHYNFIVRDGINGLAIGVVAENHYVARCDCIAHCEEEYGFTPDEASVELVEFWDLDE